VIALARNPVSNCVMLPLRFNLIAIHVLLQNSYLLDVMGSVFTLMSAVIGIRMILNLREVGRKQLEIYNDGAEISTIQFSS